MFCLFVWLWDPYVFSFVLDVFDLLSIFVWIGCVIALNFKVFSCFVYLGRKILMVLSLSWRIALFYLPVKIILVEIDCLTKFQPARVLLFLHNKFFNPHLFRPQQRLSFNLMTIRLE